MDILKEQSSNNYNEVRDRLLLCNSSISKNTSISSAKSSKVYYERIEWNNAIVVDEDNNNSNVSPELSYKTSQEKALYLSTVAENQLNTKFT